MDLSLEFDQKKDWQLAHKVRIMHGDFIDQVAVKKMHLWAIERFEDHYHPCNLQGGNDYQYAFRFKEESEAMMFIMRWHLAPSTE